MGDFLEELKPSVSLCHYDLHQRNMIYDEDNGTVTLVDFEFCAYSYEAQDYNIPFLGRTGHIFFGL